MIKKINTDAILTSICEILYKDRKTNNKIEFDTDLMIGYYWYRIKIRRYDSSRFIRINDITIKYTFYSNEDLYNCFNRYLILFRNQTKNNTINILNLFLQYFKDNIDLDAEIEVDTDSFIKKYNYLGPKIKVSYKYVLIGVGKKKQL